MLLMVANDPHSCGSFPHDIPSSHTVKNHDGVRSNIDGFLIESLFNNDALWHPVECWHGHSFFAWLTDYTIATGQA